MNIDQFLLESQPIDKLVNSYIEMEQVYDSAGKANNRKKEAALLNSILVALATKHTTMTAVWNEIKYCLQVNSGNRDCLRRGAQLLTEVFKRNSQSLQSTPQASLLEIVQLSCEKALITVCGNDFIALIEHITSRVSLASELQQALPTTITLITSNKLQVNTYRQETRLCLYRILLSLLQLSQYRSVLLEKCVRAGEGEKDPRNIGLVFELYLKVLSIYPAEQLLAYRASMFQNIQAYYPIEFVGDEDNEDHKKVNFIEISSLLDQCLCHPFFSELSWELLSSKTAAPPLAPFISTLLSYFRSLRQHPNSSLNSRLASLLIRFSEEEFIGQEYEQHAAQDLSTVIEGLLDVIFCREGGDPQEDSSVAVKKWLDSMLTKVTTGECHHSGTLMGIFRAIINRVETPRFTTLIELVRSLSLKAILRTISEGQIIPKLGLAVVVVTSAEKVSEDVRELIGLLVLKIGSLYNTVSDEVKLLLLKILLQVFKSAESYRCMVRKVNDGFILKDILSKAQTAFSSNPNPNQAYMVKAFIDFVATVYSNEIDLLLQHVSGANFELQAYLVGRLWENAHKVEEKQFETKVVSKLSELIRLMSKTEDGDNIVKGLKVVNKLLLLQLILSANWQRQSQAQALVFSVLLALRQTLQSLEYDNNNLIQKQSKSGFSVILSQFFFNRNQHELTLSKEQQLWRALGHQQQEKVTFPLMQNIQTYDIYSQLQQKFITAYPPTFVQWNWQQLKGSGQSQAKARRQGELLRWLPQPVLLRDRNEVLNIILKDGRWASSLLKIAKNIDISTIRETGIVEYCLQYVHSLKTVQTTDNTTERSTCILATLISIAQRDKNGQLKQIIRQGQRVLRQLKQHRKRPIRQAVRRLLSLLQE